MAAREHFVARFLHECEAISFSANVSEGWLHAWRWLLKLISTESARGSILLIAGLACMIWLCLTFDAEILSTSIASDSVLSHVLCRFPANQVSFIVLLALNNLTSLHHHHISTGATDHIRIIFDDLHKLSFFNLLLILFRLKLLALKFCNFLVTPWAFHFLILRLLFNNLFPEAVDVDLVKAISTLEHVQVRIQLIVLADKLVAQHTETLLTHLLHLLVDR